VPQGLPGRNVHLTAIQVLMQTWQHQSIARTLITLRMLRSNGRVKEVARREVGENRNRRFYPWGVWNEQEQEEPRSMLTTEESEEHVQSRACRNCQKEKAFRGEEAVCLKHKSWKGN
jgi:hypothetical protein